MSCCENHEAEPICPCGGFVHPRVITNQAGREVLSYRVGDYTTFRHALLQALLDPSDPTRLAETELSRLEGGRIVQVWRPTPKGDLALQAMEWWAYLADILTFYNERIASQDYLRTADRPESVNRLIRLLGYRPRPGIGATGSLAATPTGPKSFTLPKGFQIQDKPGPGKQPQVFELDAELTLPSLSTDSATDSTGAMGVAPASDSNASLLLPGSTNESAAVLLKGVSSAVKKGDSLLIVATDESKPPTDFILGNATEVSHLKDPQLGRLTRIKFLPTNPLTNPPLQGKITNFRLLRSNQSSQVWQYPASAVVRGDTTQTQVDLAGIVRSLRVGDFIIFEFADWKSPAALGTVQGSTEVIWYANAKDYQSSGPVDPAKPPPDPKTNPPFPIPHTSITITPGLPAVDDTTNNRARFLIRHGWQEVGNLTGLAKPTIAPVPPPSSGSTTPVTLQPPDGTSFPKPTVSTKVLVEDALGNGAKATLDPIGELTLDSPSPSLTPPLRVLLNLLPVSRGKTVIQEILGNGNAAVPAQDFVLQNAPVTYLSDKDSKSGEDYSSTVRVWVNDLEWKEVRTFYNQAPNAQVFITREDDQGKTHVVFGDGELGARLPTGSNNIVASYRYGSGAEAPDAGSLTVILQPRPGLKAIRNPVPVGAGADPDPAKKIRQLAPRSVLTFGRAVSEEDYEVIASQAPGVTRARAAYSFDAVQQRPVVRIWVGDDDPAVDAVKKALTDTADPNRPARVEPARAIPMRLGLVLALDPRREEEKVKAAVRAALVDPDEGLLGLHVVRIGQALYDSQLYAACLNVPGVQAVHSFDFSPKNGGVAATSKLADPLGCSCAQRHDPGEDGYFSLADADLQFQ